MLFVKTEDLKPGMRLAKPIYNRNGVMLYERNSKITSQGIISVNNFGLIGIYILEPAEPVPPMSEDDIEFLDSKVVCHSIPIRPGRNVAIICESAAVNHRQKKMGYNAAVELYNRVTNNLAEKRKNNK